MNRGRVVMLALPAILALAAFLRFFELARYPPALHSDEAINGINALQVVRLHQIRVFYPENNGREGLFINLQALAVWVFGPHPWALRFVSGMFGLTTVLGLFFLVRELFSGTLAPSEGDSRRVFEPTRVALVAAFLLATSFWHVLVSRLGFRAISAAFWAVWSFYLLLVAWRKIVDVSEPSARPHPRLRWLALFAGVIFGLGFHSYTAYRVMPLLGGVLFTLQSGEARRRGRPRQFVTYATAVVAGTIIAIAPLGWYFMHHAHDFLGRTGELSVFNSKTPVVDLAGNVIKTMGMFHVVGDTNPRHNLTGRAWLAALAATVGADVRHQQLIRQLGQPQLYWPVGLAFLIGLFSALRRVVHEPRDVRIFLLAWLAVAAIPVVLSNEDLPHALRSILMIPPVFTFAAMGAILACCGVARWADRRAASVPLRIAIRIGTWACGALLVVQTFVTYFLVWGPAPLTAERFNKEINDKAAALRALPADVPKYVVVPPDSTGLEILEFLTDTCTPETQRQQNVRYVRPDDVELETLPPGAYVTALK